MSFSLGRKVSFIFLFMLLICSSYVVSAGVDRNAGMEKMGYELRDNRWVHSETGVIMNVKFVNQMSESEFRKNVVTHYGWVSEGDSYYIDGASGYNRTYDQLLGASDKDFDGYMRTGELVGEHGWTYEDERFSNGYDTMALSDNDIANLSDDEYNGFTRSDKLIHAGYDHDDSNVNWEHENGDRGMDEYNEFTTEQAGGWNEDTFDEVLFSGEMVNSDYNYNPEADSWKNANTGKEYTTDDAKSRFKDPFGTYAPTDMASGSGGLVPCGNEGTPCTLCHLFVGINNILAWGRNILVSVAFLVIVVAGIMYITSAGNQQSMESAKGVLKRALTGFAVVLGAWLIVNIAMNLIATREGLGVNATSWSKFECKL
ncbi:pilin [Patescibacteria group bacterium]